MTIGANLGDILFRVAFDHRSRDRTALLSEGATHSFGQLQERAWRLANALLGLGVKPGDRVAVLMSNVPAWPETLFACSAIGAVCVPINVLLNGREINHVVNDCGAIALIADWVGERALADVSTLPSILIRVGDFEQPAGGSWLAYEDVVVRAAARAIPYRPVSQDPVMIYYTSGTTGLPKGAVHSHAGVLWNTIHQIADVGLTRDDAYLLIPSLSWSAGFHDVMLALMSLGGRIVMTATGRLTIERIIDTIEKEQVSHVLLVPTLLKMLIATPGAFERLRRTRLRRIFTGGEFVPPSIIDAVNAELPESRVIQLYGMSEFPLMMTITDIADNTTMSTRTGRPSSITTMGIRTPEGEVRSIGEGEIVIRSPATMSHYHNKEEATREALRGDWFATGDLGVLDEEGFLTLNGRAKDMIISGGLNIYSREIEDVILRLRGVTDVAVVGVPDDKWGEVPVAIVVSHENEGVTQAVRAACERELSGFKRPATTLLYDGAFPRTPSGKLLKRELRVWAASRLAAERK